MLSSELDRVRAELTERESAFLRISEYLDTVTNLLEGHAQIVASIRSVTDLYKKMAGEIERRRFDALAADLSGEPPPEP